LTNILPGMGPRQAEKEPVKGAEKKRKKRSSFRSKKRKILRVLGVRTDYLGPPDRWRIIQTTVDHMLQGKRKKSLPEKNSRELYCETLSASSG